jgi:ubiquinone/menaquinone biosynthesis C-methylase UbiE
VGQFEKDMRHADWDKVYDRQSRRAAQVPEWLDAIGLKAGDRVLEVGSGPGFVTLMMAERVGPGGLVYAVDSSVDALAHLERRQQERGIAHIRRIAADAATLDEDLKADAALVTMVLHHLDEPAALVRNLKRLVRPGAHVLVGEFHPDGPCEYGAPRESRIAPNRVREWLTDAGFEVLDERRQTPEHYWVLARRNAQD